MKLYGIPNCTTVKKAREWLTGQGIDYAFHDYKKAGVPEALMKKLLKQHGWEALINRKGPTWRKLPDERKKAIQDATSALAVMLENPSVIRRPILEDAGRYLIGFVADDYAAFFATR